MAENQRRKSTGFIHRIEGSVCSELSNFGIKAGGTRLIAHARWNLGASGGPNTKSIVDDIVPNGDNDYPAGHKTEALSRLLFEQDGYVHYNGHYNNSGNGFDNVFVKGPLNNPTEVIINEAKQWPPMLAGPGVNAPSQMTDDWVDYVLGHLQGVNPELANAIDNALRNGKLTKVVTAVKRTGNSQDDVGRIFTIRVD